MTPRDFIDGHEADIVPVARIFRAGIAEADKEQHDAASRGVRAYFFLSPPAGAFAPAAGAAAAAAGAAAPGAGAATAAGAAPGAAAPAAAAAAARCSSASPGGGTR